MAYTFYSAFVLLQLPLVLAAVVGVIVATALGVIVERFVLRPLVGESAISVIMVTIGLSTILRAVVQLFFGTAVREQPDILPTGSISLGGATVPINRLLVILIAAVVLGLFEMCIRDSSEVDEEGSERRDDGKPAQVAVRQDGELGAEAIARGARVLADDVGERQGAQQAVGGGQRQARALGEVGQRAEPGALREQLQQGDGVAHGAQSAAGIGSAVGHRFTSLRRQNSATLELESGFHKFTLAFHISES